MLLFIITIHQIT